MTAGAARPARDVLGVEAGADLAAVREAWRRHAQRLKGGTLPGTEDEFRQLRTAYEELAGYRNPAAPRRPGADLELEVDVPLTLACSGGRQVVAHEFRRAGPRRVVLDLPAGVEPGFVRRFPGQGAAGDPPGDLRVVVRRVVLEAGWRAEGLDLWGTLRVQLADLVEGAVVDVDAPTGRHRVRLPRACFLPVRVPRVGLRRGALLGDLVLELQVRWPEPTGWLLREMRRGA